MKTGGVQLGLAKVINDTYYEKVINELIDDILDETGNEKILLAKNWNQIRIESKIVNDELRCLLDSIVAKLNKSGYPVVLLKKAEERQEGTGSFYEQNA